MNNLNEMQLKEYPYQNLKKVSDLFNSDGPLLSQYQDETGMNYLYLLADNNPKENKWMVFKAHKHDLEHYLKGSISLLELIQHPINERVILVDTDAAFNYSNVVSLKPYDVPINYLPTHRSYYLVDTTI